MEPLGHAYALRVTQGILAITASSPLYAQHLLTQLRMALTVSFTALMVEILEARPGRALVQIVMLVLEE